MAARSPAFLWARIAVLGALLLGTYGLVINDEQDQAASLHNVAEGSLEVREHPAQFYHISGDLHNKVRFPGPEPIGSTLLNYLSIPMLGVVRLADAAMPLGVWAAAAALGLAWSLVPPDRRPGSPLAGALVALAGLTLLASGFRFPRVDVGLYGAVIALQWTNILLLGIAAAFLARALGRHVPWPAGHVVMAAIVFGPLMFWGARLKYSMLAAALVCAALWLAGEPASRRRDLALGLIAAFAVWNNIGEGAILLAAGGVWFLVHSIRKGTVVPRAGTTAACLLLGLLLGLVPWGLENETLRGHPLDASYLSPLDGTQEPVSRGVGVYVGLALGDNVWDGPLDFALDAMGAWTSGWRVEGDPVGVLALSPLLGLGLLAFVRPWRHGPDILLAALVILWHLVLLTNRVVVQGWGYDVRLLLPALPAATVLAAPTVGRILERHGPDAPRFTLQAMVAFVVAGAAYFTVIGLTFDQGLKGWTNDRSLFWIFGILGASFVAILAVGRRSSLLPLKRPLTLALVAFAAALPLVWGLLAAFGGSSSAPVEGEGRTSGFVPLVQDLRAWLTPQLFPPAPLPLVTDEYGRVVFHPEFGYCAVDPSPCPWWSDATTGPGGNATA